MTEALRDVGTCVSLRQEGWAERRWLGPIGTPYLCTLLPALGTRSGGHDAVPPPPLRHLLRRAKRSRGTGRGARLAARRGPRRRRRRLGRDKGARGPGGGGRRARRVRSAAGGTGYRVLGVGHYGVLRHRRGARGFKVVVAVAVAAYAPGEEPARARGFETGAGDVDGACGIKVWRWVLGDMLRAEVPIRGIHLLCRREVRRRGSAKGGVHKLVRSSGCRRVFFTMKSVVSGGPIGWA